MANSSSLTLVVGVLGGALAGFLVAQVVPDVSGFSGQADTDETEQALPIDSIEGLGSLTLDERLRGELTTSGELNGNDGSRSLYYRLALDEDSLVELDLNGALQGTVTLYDDHLQMLSSGAPLRHRIEEAGDYLVVVSGMDASSYGPFTLYPRTVEISDSDTLTVDEPADYWMQSDEEVVTLTVEEAGLYQIDMRSDEFDAYLTIEGPNGYRRNDDDSGGDLDAQITDFLAPGEYTVKAQTYGSGNGMYTLSATLSEQAGDFRNDGPIAPGESLTGWYNNAPLEYTLEIEEAGMYQIDMRSSDVDAFLELHDDDGYSRENDDGGDGYDARLADFLAPGTYRIVARTAFETTSGGQFTLAVEENELPEGTELQNGGELTPGETLSGWYSGEDVTYQLEVEQSSAVTIALDSNHFDTYLELTGNGVSESNDDGGSGTNALLETSLLPGTYTVHARGYSASESGLFELTTELEPTDIEPDA
ncbi:hypothetical protein ACGLWX_07475 [Halomonas sp. HMF6819]|uniref:hypothetical protein n=1 Tax=unclassified Halomonas TaxID=2609666 RepID=UPI0020767442|nr:MULTISPECIES: hypothetical protein [unclassified Halomonas]